MRRKKAQPDIQVTCNHCGSKTETFVATPDHLLFCRIHTPGQEPEKDCMTDYFKEKRNVQEKEKEGRLRTQQKISFQNKEIEKEKVLTDRTTAIKKLDELKQFLSKKKQASFQKTPS